MLNKSLRELMDEYLCQVFNGTAHPHRLSVLSDFVEWVEGYEEFMSECDGKINEALESAELERVK